MDASNEIKIISMLGEMNNKITEINMDIKDIKERMNRNFALLVDAQISQSSKIDKILENVENIDFRVKLAESGISFNANRIKEINNVK